jgi:hypothetical protein
MKTGTINKTKTKGGLDISPTTVSDNSSVKKQISQVFVMKKSYRENYIFF